MESQATPFAKTPSPLGLSVCRRLSRPRGRSQILFPPPSFCSQLLRIRIKSPATTSTSSTPLKSLFLLPLRAFHDHGHHHHHPHQQHGHHHHGHSHDHDGELNGAQRAVLRFAKKVGWADLADLLRENLQLCCCSMALLLLAAVSPCVLPPRAIRPLQGLLIALAFPLVGVSAALDAVLNIAAGKINIHVLMALAAFASVFMGNSLEGALLLAMFNLAHIAEEYFTSRAMADVTELKDNHPDFALVLEADEDGLMHFTKLNYKKVPVCELEVGSNILVRAGEVL